MNKRVSDSEKPSTATNHRRSRATSPTASQSETACPAEVGTIEILGGSAFRPVFMGNLRVSIDLRDSYSKTRLSRSSGRATQEEPNHPKSHSQPVPQTALPQPNPLLPLQKLFISRPTMTPDPQGHPRRTQPQIPEPQRVWNRQLDPDLSSLTHRGLQGFSTDPTTEIDPAED
jgi:hypothetical protein